MKSRLLAGLLLAVILSLAMPVTAQDTDLTADEEALIVVVQEAVEALFAIETFQARTETLITQTIGTSAGGQDITIDQTIEQNSDAQIATSDGGIDESYTLLSQNTSMTASVPGLSQDIPLTMEAILTDGQYYLRFSDTPVELTGIFPEGWFLPEDLAIPGFDFAAMANLTGRESLALYEVSLETITAIQELEGTTLDGQEMRVISATFDADTLFELAGLDALFDPEAMGVGDDFLQDMLDASVYDYIIYIGVDDGLPHRIDNNSTINDMATEIQGESLTLTQESIATTTFFGFGEPVEIPEPVLGE